MSEPRRVVLLDSSGALHRCFHGYPPRRGRLDGETIECAALYGYGEYVRKLASELEFEHLVHVLDNPNGSQFRKDLYPAYKGQRSEKDPNLVRQEALLPQFLQGLGQAYVQRDGVEADDLVASLAKQLAAQGDEVLVISQDKDLLQLVVDGQIVVGRYVDQGPGRPKTHELYEEADVLARMGVRPNQIADYLALVGDSVDNIPGVPKVGPKTAAAWLTEHGSLANLMTQSAQIAGALGQRLRDSLGDLPTYRRLTGCLEDLGVALPDRPVLDNVQVAWSKGLVSAPNHWPDDLIGDLVVAEFVQPPTPVAAPSNGSRRPF